MSNRDIQPTPIAMWIMLGAIVCGGLFIASEPKKTGTVSWMGNTATAQWEYPWCNHQTYETWTTCQMQDDKRIIPLVSAGTCPGSYEIWIYSKNKPAICVRRA